ncbi:DoxX family protein [Arenibacter algicola]|uniref:DoxX family protein n=1 Tax=Arenibacter algicola TaxID=616991 RepID=UPI001C076C1B|nr:DoxX family protein [Arenibacter algicola]MBU2907471.1 DoxX family protein [Arenibacter algicola]
MIKIASRIINIISMVAMGYFAIPKLLAKPMSVAGFQQFENAIQINADFFRVFTGIAEISMVLFILYFSITQKIRVGIFAYAFLLITMISALILEFFARPEPKMLLVIIAILLALFSVYQLLYLKKQTR